MVRSRIDKPNTMPALLYPRTLPRLGLATLLAALLATAGCSPSPPAAAPATPPQVGVHTVVAQRQAILAELPGRTSASQVAEIRPQVGGIVQRRLFTEGALVKAGQPLYQIDPASYQADVASAQAALAKTEATLAAARLTAARQAELLKIDAISRQLADDSQAALQQAQADVGVARATLDARRISLERTRISAPINGRTDLSSVTAGALVSAGQATALTTVQQLDPMVVDLVQSSAELLALKRELASGKLAKGDADEAPVRIVLEDGSAYPQPGKLKFSGVTVDKGTGAVTLRALVPNPDGVLLPGMFVRARLETAVAEQALLVPQQGVTRSAAGEAQALVVGAGGKVERRALTLGPAIGNRWLVEAGLKPGDQVITEGLQRVRVGQVVVATAAGAAKPAGAASGPGAASAALASR